MSRRNDTPNMGAGAFERTPKTFPCIKVIHPDGRVDTPPAETWAESNEDCEGLLWQYLTASIPGAIMWVFSAVFILISAVSWPMPTGYGVGLVLLLWVVLGLISYFPYRLGIDVGALISAVTFAVVATAVPMPEWASYTYAALIAISLVASAWFYTQSNTSEVPA